MCASGAVNMQGLAWKCLSIYWIFIHTCITIISIQQEMPIRQGILKKTNKKQHWDNPDIQILKHVLICFSLVLVLHFLADPRQVKEPFLVLGDTKQTILKSAHTHTHTHTHTRRKEKGRVGCFYIQLGARQLATSNKPICPMQYIWCSSMNPFVTG